MLKIRIGKRTVTITHPEKVMFPESNIRKGDVLSYYARIAEWMLPYLKHRPLTMMRYPEGIHHEGFYHKNMPDYFPTWIPRVSIAKKTEHGSSKYVICNTIETLIYIVNQNCLTPHLWLSKVDKLNYPDRLIFDLDPADTTPFSAIKTTALQLKNILEAFKLIPFVMTTGSRGLHVVIPLKRMLSFTQTRECARYIAEILVQQYPDHLTLESRKEKREHRLLIDIMRNSYAATSVAPYAIRAKSNAPIATPLSWEELESTTLTATTYTIQNIFKRLSKVHDPWKHFLQSACSLSALQKKMLEK